MRDAAAAKGCNCSSIASLRLVGARKKGARGLRKCVAFELAGGRNFVVTDLSDADESTDSRRDVVLPRRPPRCFDHPSKEDPSRQSVGLG
jgi:hypothetical protein